MEKQCVLVVEDEIVTALDIKYRLEDQGFYVPDLINSGEEAVRMAAEIRPDLVLMDISLHGEMDGMDAASKISSLDIPVVYLTATSDEFTIEKAKNTNAYGYILKPLRNNELQITIEMAIKRHNSDQNERDKIKSDQNEREKIKQKTTHKKMVKNLPTQLGKHDVPQILVVEDEAIISMGIKEKLEDLGHEVIDIAFSGEEAVEKAIKLEPDLILMDIVLKGDMDGIEAASEIRNRLDVPIIYLTAYSDEETLKRARATSPYGYLIKPYHKEELNSVIQVALEHKKSEDVREKNLEEKVTSKQQELKIEKTGVFFISSLILSMAVYGFATRSMTWLEYLLFIPAVYNLLLVSISFKTPKKPDKPMKLPMVSILIPAHNEGLTIEKCVRSIAELNYHEDGKPLYEIIVINDGSTDQTGDILRDLKKEVENLKIVTRKAPRAGKGKGHVLNDGFRVSRGEVIAVFDADAKVKPDFLQKIIPYLDDEDVVGVQARVRMYNAKLNLLTAMQEVEFSIFGNVVLRSRDVVGITSFLGGNGQLTTRKVIEEIGGWDGFAVTEDLNMSIKLMIKGYKIRYCGEAEVWQEAVPQWKPFFRQRVRWATGNLETLFVYLNSIIDAKIPIYSKIDSIQYLFFLLLTAFVMIGYIVAILSLGHVLIFKMTAPIIIGILSSLAFFPGVMVGIYRDNKNIPKAFLQTVEYWAYCLYLVPLFIAAFLNMLTRTERHWAKTRHTGEVESEFQKNKVITQKTLPEILKTDIDTNKR